MPLADYLTGFYVQPAPDYRQTFRPGQLYFAPTFYLPAHPDVLYEVAEDPTEERLRFEIRRMGPRSFHDIHRPLATIGLASSEELVAIKAKKRLVVLLSQENFVAEALGGRVARAAKIHERSYVCLPLYGVHRGAGERGFPPEVVVRIQALMYNQFFYFPPYPPGADQPIVYEGIGRLDRLQVFHRDTLAADPVRLALHPDFLEVLHEWVRFHLTGRIDHNIAELRRELTREIYGAPP